MSDASAPGHWVTTWAAVAQGPYPLGSAIAQPDLSNALPDARAGLVQQSMRMLMRPVLWAPRWRMRLAHVFGTQPLVLRDLSLGLHWGGGALLPGTRVRLPDMVIPAGQSRWTDAVALPWMAHTPPNMMQGRCLALSARVEGQSGPITWHAKSMATSYLSAPQDPLAAGQDSETGFVHSTTSSLFVDALDAWLPTSHHAWVAFGDSLTDGTATTLNGHDRWPDVLQRLLWAEGCRDVAIVNAGIGGNQIVGPRENEPLGRGGPSALDRLQRDVLELSGVRSVLWLQGINDFSENGQRDAPTVCAAVRRALATLSARGLWVLGCTVPSALGSTRFGHGGAQQDAQRRAFNAAIRAGQLFARHADVDAALTDPVSGRLRQVFDGDSTLGEPGDGVHPNRAGHAAIARCLHAQLPPGDVPSAAP